MTCNYWDVLLVLSKWMISPLYKHSVSPVHRLYANLLTSCSRPWTKIHLGIEKKGPSCFSGFLGDDILHNYMGIIS